MDSKRDPIHALIRTSRVAYFLPFTVYGFFVVSVVAAFAL
jgi:hypothetical protein